MSGEIQKENVTSAAKPLSAGSASESGVNDGKSSKENEKQL